MSRVTPLPTESDPFAENFTEGAATTAKVVLNMTRMQTSAVIFVIPFRAARCYPNLS